MMTKSVMDLLATSCRLIYLSQLICTSTYPTDCAGYSEQRGKDFSSIREVIAEMLFNVSIFQRQILPLSIVYFYGFTLSLF